MIVNSHDFIRVPDSNLSRLASPFVNVSCTRSSASDTFRQKVRANALSAGMSSTMLVSPSGSDPVPLRSADWLILSGCKAPGSRRYLDDCDGRLRGNAGCRPLFPNFFVG